jgi:Family of unknown function (DUF5522)
MARASFSTPREKPRRMTTSRAKPVRLVEGVDFYMDGLKFVFTAAYHLKRGYCCNSKCRHCPYGRETIPLASIDFAAILPLKTPRRMG